VCGLPLTGAGLVELASPGFAASLLADPLSAWLAIMAAVLQVTALVCIKRLGRARA
jgi:Flp pilus assembly protein TadB